MNPIREKKLTNIRTTAADEKVFLVPPKVMTLEDAIGESCWDVHMSLTAGQMRQVASCPRIGSWLIERNELGSKGLCYPGC